MTIFAFSKPGITGELYTVLFCSSKDNKSNVIWLSQPQVVVTLLSDTNLEVEMTDHIHCISKCLGSRRVDVGGVGYVCHVTITD